MASFQPSSYRRDASKPRSVPAPLNLVSSPPTKPTLLYELPPATSRSPPPGSPPTTPATLLYSPKQGPASPPYSGGIHRSHARVGSGGGPGTPPSYPRSRPPPPPPRSTTPIPFQQDLDAFAANCRAWYFQQDEHAGRLMTQTLNSASSGQRAQFSRIQANIRSSYHTALTMRRASEFHAHLSSTHPGQSLTPVARANPNGKVAQKERRERLDRFIRAWCATGVPGTKPFFDGLWAVFRLQGLPENLGGAGSRRIEWEIDDAVFQESAGKDFMRDAIDVLKGVLGFEDSLPPKPQQQQQQQQQPNRTTPKVQPPPPPKRRTQVTIASTTTTSPNPASPDRESPTPTRPRAPSDPFLDPHGNTTADGVPTHSPRQGPATPPVRTTALLSDDEFEEDEGFAEGDPDDFLLGGATGASAGPGAGAGAAGGAAGTGSKAASADASHVRIWRMPDLSNPELHALFAIFPASVTRGSVPRFPIIPAQQRKRAAPAEAMQEDDLEIGPVEEESARLEVRYGTGRMWISDLERSEGWDGSWWDRFLGWWKRVFC